MIGERVSRYKIIEKIGEGGMGEVYLAEDTELERQVALKFLPSQIAGDAEVLARFKSEAKAAAALQHPNIITVHEVGSHQGRDYIVMAYIPGKPLSQLIKEREVSIDQAIDVTLQLCDALEEAHKAGVIHRDLKPDNIIIDGRGRAHVLDFGLALRGDETRLTQDGSTVGTLHYMSPEQLRGEDVDQRTDIFSLGAILYEMITRRHAFPGENAPAIQHQIISRTPQPLARYNNQATPELQRIVSNALEKDKEVRFQTMSGFAAALKPLRGDTPSTGSVAASRRRPVIVGISAVMVVLVAVVLYAVLKPSDSPQSGDAVPMIAVLPFENLGSPDDQYFADGMTEEITSRLASIKGLGVISRTSSVKLKGSDKTLKEIGRDHGIDFVLEGSVRWSKVGDQYKVRITPQLIRVSDDRHLWADNYERALIEVFAVQAEIAEKIVEQLGLTLVHRDRQNLASRPTENAEAYQYYLKALKALRGRGDHPGSMAAQAALDSAVTLDPSFALAHALRSEAYSHSAVGNPENVFGKISLEAAKRALELRPDLAQGHYALGNYYNIVARDYDRALEQFSMAKSELQNDPELLDAISNVQRREGKYEEAFENRRKAAELDPLNARRHSRLSSVLKDLRRFTEAEESINRAIALEPTVQGYYESKIACLISHYGDIAKVEPVIDEALAYCDTTEFVIKNSSVTRYIPALQTESIIADFLQKHRADTTKAGPFTGRPYFYFQHLDILQDYEDEAGRMARWYDGNVMFADWQALLLSFAGDCDRAIELGIRNKDRDLENECVSCLPSALMLMARIYANCGRYDKATDELEAVLSLKTYITVNTLKYKHWIDPLRDRARFEALTRKYE